MFSIPLIFHTCDGEYGVFVMYTGSSSPIFYEGVFFLIFWLLVMLSSLREVSASGVLGIDFYFSPSALLELLTEIPRVFLCMSAPISQDWEILECVAIFNSHAGL